MTITEAAALIDLLRAKGVAQYADDGKGAVQIVMGPEPAPKREVQAPAAEPRPAPVGPDGKPMSAYDRVLFQHTLGDEGDLQ